MVKRVLSRIAVGCFLIAAGSLFVFSFVHVSMMRRKTLPPPSYSATIYENTEAVLEVWNENQESFENVAYLLMTNSAFFRRNNLGATGYGSYDRPEDTYMGEYYSQEDADTIVKLWYDVGPHKIDLYDHFHWPLHFYFRIAKERNPMIELLYWGDEFDEEKIQEDISYQTRRGNSSIIPLERTGWYLKERHSQE